MPTNTFSRNTKIVNFTSNTIQTNSKLTKDNKKEKYSLRQLSGAKNGEFGFLRVGIGDTIALKKLLEQLLGVLRISALTLNLIQSPKPKISLVHLQFQPLPLVHSPHIPKPSQPHKPQRTKLLPRPPQNPRLHVAQLPRLRRAIAPDRRLQFLLVLLHAAHAVNENGLGLESHDAARMVVGESEAEGGSARRELSGRAVEEAILLAVGADVEWGQNIGDATVGHRVWKP